MTSDRPRFSSASSAALCAGGILAGIAAGNAAGGEGLPFTSEAPERGIQYTMGSGTSGGQFGFGICLADLTGNGHLDLVLIGRTSGMPGIFENDGTGHFTNRTVDAAIPPLAAASAVYAFDFDGDRDLELLFTQVPGPTRLYRNDGNFAFVEVTAKAGLGAVMYTKGGSIADFDEDGWLDLYLCNYSPDPAFSRNLLYRNRGDGTFEEIGESLGVDSTWLSFQSVFATVDASGRPGLYLSNDHRGFGGRNMLWRNEGGTFTEVGLETGAGVQLDSMGLAAGDFNGDGLTDFYLTNTREAYGVSPGNPLLLSRPNGQYVRSDAEWGVTVDETGWGCHFWDFDNDGHLDLYVNNIDQPNNLFRHEGQPPMVDVAAAFAVDGTLTPSYASAFGDVDGDGDLDLVQNNLGGSVRLYMNHEGSRRHWLRVRVAGVFPNHHAIGARVALRVDSKSAEFPQTQWAEVRIGGNAYLSQQETTVHFGLDTVAEAAEVEVRWPGGGPVRILRNLPANEVWTAYHPDLLGDSDGNGVVGLPDWAALCEGFGGTVEPGREMLDFNGDWRIDAVDAEAFWTRAAVRRGDLDASGRVDGGDLAMLLSAWGTGGADLDCSGGTDGADLAILLANWTRGR
jgi:hypothetical protein